MVDVVPAPGTTGEGSLVTLVVAIVDVGLG